MHPAQVKCQHQLPPRISLSLPVLQARQVTEEREREDEV